MKIERRNMTVKNREPNLKQKPGTSTFDSTQWGSNRYMLKLQAKQRRLNKMLSKPQR